MENQALPTFQGFKCLKLLGQGTTSSVYLAARDGKEYAIKLFRKGDSSNSEDRLFQFRKEAALMARINHSGLIRIFEVQEDETQVYLVMEYVAGQNLAQAILKHPLSETQIIQIAKSVAAALSAMHERGLVHRDVKPANLLLDPQAHAKLIDFGFAFEEADDKNSWMVGSFLYSSPEQLRIVKKPVSGRSDLYSLGVVLFEAATGKVPFEATDLGKLVQIHRGGSIPDAHDQNPQIRPMLGQVIRKLMAKDPDDRYQSAEGLIWDLEHLLELETTQTLGSQDRRIRVLDMPVVGREKEIHTLQESWKKAKAGQGQWVQIEGEPGSGKTRLIREIIRFAKAEKALFLSGKALQNESVPYGPLKEALDQLFKPIFRMPEEEKNQELEAIQKMAADFAPVVKRFSSYLQKALPNVKEEKISANTQNQFYHSIAQFLMGISQIKGPLLLLIDDVQWLDQGTLSVLKELKKMIPGSRLLLVSTARNDATSSDSLKGFLKEVGKDLNVRAILKPLDEASCRTLIAAHLGDKPLEEDYVRKLLFKSKGNPFAIGQYLRALLEKGVLTPSKVGWKVNATRFEAIDLPADVIDLLKNRISDIPKEFFPVFQTAAVIGFEFQTELLQKGVGERSGTELTSRALEQGLVANLIERSEDGYLWLHDKIQEAFLSQLTELEKRRLNQKLAECLDFLPNQPELHYSLARFYGRGQREKTPKRVYRTNLDAGILALEQGGTQEAYSFLKTAEEVFTTFNGEVMGADTLLFFEKLGVVAGLIGKYSEAHLYLERVGQLSTDPEVIVRISFVRGLAYTAETKYELAVEQCKIILSSLGASVPKNSLLLAANILVKFLLGYLFEFTHFRYGVASQTGREKEKERLQAILGASAFLGVAAAPLGRMSDLLLSACNFFYYSRALGDSRERLDSHLALALMNTLFRFSGVSRYHLRESEKLVKRLDTQDDLHVFQFFRAIAMEQSGQSEAYWIQDRAELLAAYLKHYEQKTHLSKVAELGSIASFHVQWFILRGRAREVVDFLQNPRNSAIQDESTGYLLNGFSSLYSQLILLGRLPEATALIPQRKSLLKKVKTKYATLQSDMHELLADLDLEKFDSETESRICRIEKANLYDFSSRLGNTVIAHIRMEQYRTASRDERPKLRQALVRSIENACFPWPLSQPPVFSCHRWLLRGALALEDGMFKKAIRYLDQAEKDIKKADTLWGEWVLARERAWLEKKMGQEERFKEHAQAAYQIAKENGWIHRSKKIIREFGLAVAPSVQSLRSTSLFSKSTNGSFRSFRDFKPKRYLDALLQLSHASAQVMEPDVQARIALDEAIKILNAERGFLLLADETSEVLHPKKARNSKGEDLARMNEYSTTMVAQVQSTLTAAVFTGDESQDLSKSQSVKAFHLRSMMAAPMLKHDKLIGVIYLDSTIAQGIFTEEDVDILLAIAGHIAIALEAAQMRKLEAEKLALERAQEESDKVAALLNNIRQAVFSVDQNGIIIPPVSNFCETLFQRSIINQEVSKILFSELDPVSEDWSKLKTALATIFGESELQWELMKDNMVTRTTLQKGQQILKIGYAPLWDNDGNMKHLMFVVENLTEVEKLQQTVATEKAAQERSFQIVGELIPRDPREVRDFLDSSQASISEFINSLRNLTSPTERARLLRNVHTLKGNSRTLGFNFIASVTHAAETSLVELFSWIQNQAPGIQPTEEALENARTELEKIRTQIQEYEATSRQVFRGSAGASPETHSLSPERISRLKTAIRGGQVQAIVEALQEIKAS